jgi:hypothetical protein
VTLRTIAVKIVEGINSQGWTVSGYGGSWAGAARPIQDYIERKVARAVQAEREACAKVCEDMDLRNNELRPEYRRGLSNAARTIRARGKQ